MAYSESGEWRVTLAVWLPCARHFVLRSSSAVLAANLINMRAFIQINQRQSNRLRGVGRLTPQFPHSIIFPSPSRSLSLCLSHVLHASLRLMVYKFELISCLRHMYRYTQTCTNAHIQYIHTLPHVPSEISLMCGKL